MNVKFIGPPAKAIHGMGDKLESKRLAIKAGVNTVRHLFKFITCRFKVYA